ncbi:MAG TPA: pyridoxamine 5'-phosphate oxidase family protein [Iamia sp.]|jgi:hypothetical protein|nr:pyridoxamine 5'-phosphate oxidase family protein [Iamia sp.]
METKNLADLYDLPTLEWDQVVAHLDTDGVKASEEEPTGEDWWLATIDADGKPHVAGIGALWHDGALWFKTGPKARKGRNVERDPRCTISVATDRYHLVFEGEAIRVDDPATVAAIVALWVEGGWPAEVDETGRAITAPYSAPSAGPPPWHLYRVDVQTVTALLIADPGGATRWSF